MLVSHVVSNLIYLFVFTPLCDCFRFIITPLLQHQNKQTKIKITAMRGKYITTSLKLAVGSKAKKSLISEVKERKASIKNFEVIWSKEMSLDKANAAKIARPELAVA
jgi:Na+/phosphate symporter